MKRSQLIEQWRKLMRDDAGIKDTHRLWTEAEVNDLFAVACDETCSETSYLSGSMVDAVCLVPLTPETRHYKLHPAVLSVISVRPSWRSRLLDKTETAVMDDSSPAWLTATGRPQNWLLDYEAGYLTFSHAPTAEGDNVRLAVVRRQVDNTAETLEIPEQWHKHLKFYMGYQALFKQDSEVSGAVKQADFLATWDRCVEEMKRDILKMGKSRVSLSFT